MDSSAIADRRQLRRRLGFWRIVAVLLLVALGFALYRFIIGDLPDTRGPQVARVTISGLIQDDPELLERLKKIRDNDQVKALIVSISSTGGTTYGGERIFKAIRAVAAKKPVVSDIRTVAASAGYMIAAAGDELLLLVITDKLERETQAAEWVRALQARGAWLPIWPIARAQLPQWLQARFRAAGLRADEEALELLAERSEGNLLAAQQEIEKLALLLPPGAAVSATEVAASSADSARFDVFQLGEAVRAMEPGRSLRILAGLQAEGAEALLVLWGLLRIMHGLQASGFSPAGRTGPRPSFARLAARAARVDRVAKGLERGDAWDELALLAVELCGLRPLPWLRAG